MVCGVCIKFVCVIFVGQNLSFEPQLERSWDELQEKVRVCVTNAHPYISDKCVHVYVCVCARVCVCTSYYLYRCVYVYMCVYACLCVCLCVCMCMCGYINVYVCRYICVIKHLIYLCTLAHMCP